MDVAARKRRLPGSVAGAQDPVPAIRPAGGRLARIPGPQARSRRPATPVLEHTIRDDQDSAVRMDDIHFNPVKHRLAARPADWPFSGFAKCVMLGLYPIDWAIDGFGLADTGERL
jgi:hypothetical protein